MDSSCRAPWRGVVAQLAAQQDDLMTSAQFRSLGVARSTVSGRTRQGLWSQVLPGVVLTTGGRPDRQQRERAALLYALLGAGSALLSGRTALRRLGVQALRLQEVSDRPVSADHVPLGQASPDMVHVLVPHERHVTSTHFVDITRTRRWPDFMEVDGLPQVVTARAVADVARTCTSADEVMRLVNECVQRGLTTDDELLAELRDGARQQSAHLRTVLRRRTATQADTLFKSVGDLVLAAALPEPQWQPRLITPTGDFVGSPMAWIDCVGLALELVSTDPASIARQQRLAMYGIPVFPVSPTLLARDPRGQARTLAHAADRAACSVRMVVAA